MKLLNKNKALDASIDSLIKARSFLDKLIDLRNDVDYYKGLKDQQSIKEVGKEQITSSCLAMAKVPNNTWFATCLGKLNHSGNHWFKYLNNQGESANFEWSNDTTQQITEGIKQIMTEAITGANLCNASVIIECHSEQEMIFIDYPGAEGNHLPGSPTIQEIRCNQPKEHKDDHQASNPFRIGDRLLKWPNKIYCPSTFEASFTTTDEYPITLQCIEEKGHQGRFHQAKNPWYPTNNPTWDTEYIKWEDKDLQIQQLNEQLNTNCNASILKPNSDTYLHCIKEKDHNKYQLDQHQSEYYKDSNGLTNRLCWIDQDNKRNCNQSVYTLTYDTEDAIARGFATSSEPKKDWFILQYKYDPSFEGCPHYLVLGNTDPLTPMNRKDYQCTYDKNHIGQHRTFRNNTAIFWDDHENKIAKEEIDNQSFVDCLAFCNKPFTSNINENETYYCLGEIGHSGECGYYNGHTLLEQLQRRLKQLNQHQKNKESNIQQCPSIKTIVNFYDDLKKKVPRQCELLDKHEGSHQFTLVDSRCISWTMSDDDVKKYNEKIKS